MLDDSAAVWDFSYKNAFATLKAHQTFFGGIYRLALESIFMMFSLIVDLVLFFSNRII